MFVQGKICKEKNIDISEISQDINPIKFENLHEIKIILIYI